MLNKVISNKINAKLIETNWTKKQLAEYIGKSYNNVVNVINRKLNSKNIEYLLKKWVNE